METVYETGPIQQAGGLDFVTESWTYDSYFYLYISYGPMGPMGPRGRAGDGGRGQQGAAVAKAGSGRRR